MLSSADCCELAEAFTRGTTGLNCLVTVSIQREKLRRSGKLESSSVNLTIAACTLTEHVVQSIQKLLTDCSKRSMCYLILAKEHNVTKLVSVTQGHVSFFPYIIFVLVQVWILSAVQSSRKRNQREMLPNHV